MLKRVFILFSIITILGLYTPAYAAQPSIEFLAPNTVATFLPGDTIHIRYRVTGFTPTPRNPIFLHLLQPSTRRRLFIQRISDAHEGINIFTYQVPETFYAAKREWFPNLKYQFAVRANVNGEWLNVKSKPAFHIKAESENSSTTTQPSSSQLPEAETIETPPTSPEVAVPTTGSLADLVVTAGSHDQLVAEYNITSLREGYYLNKLTIVNDTDNNLYDYEDTNLIEKVKIVYQDENAIWRAASSAMVGGKATFNIADKPMYIGRGLTQILKIYVDIRDLNSSEFLLSGRSFRVGIFQNNTQSTFNATGKASGDTTFNFETFGSTHEIKDHIVRKAKPRISTIVPMSSPSFMGGTNNLYQFTVTAEGGNITLSRLVFEISVNGFTGGGENMSGFKLMRGSSLNNLSIANGVNVYGMDENGLNVTDIKNGSFDGIDGVFGNGINNGTYKIITSFDYPEFINEGETITYALRGDQFGGNNNDTITTRLAGGDEASPLTGLTINNTNANTGLIYSGAGGTIFNVGNGFSQSLLSNRNIIWSDQSGGKIGPVSGAHAYPDIANGTVSNATGSVDFTNGYGLNIAAQEAITYKQ